MNALVTGGGGFLGRAIVTRLLARGDAVRIFSRGEYPDLKALGCDCVQGDLRDPQAIRTASADIDVVFHVAAVPGMWGPRERFFSINLAGTENVIAGCRSQKVPRLVYTSSPSVVFAMRDIEGANEELEYPKRYWAHYPESKALAEQRILAAHSTALATCSLRPHLIWGPGDNHIIPMLIKRAKAGKLLQVGEGKNRVDVTYIDNAADAHLLAADALAPESAVGGRAYFIGDQEPVNLWDWIRELLTMLDLPPPTRRIPYRSAYALGGVMEAAYTYLPLRGEPRLTRFLAAQFALSHYFDHRRARTDFGYHPQVSNADGLEQTVKWFKNL